MTAYIMFNKKPLNSRLIQWHSSVANVNIGVWGKNTVVHHENNLEKTGLESKHSQLHLIRH